MQTYTIDIETTEIPPSGIKDIERIHCFVAKCLETGKIHTAATTRSKDKLLKLLESAETLIYHNGIGFDLPVLRKFYPDWKFNGRSFDTLVMSRAMWPDIANKDYGRCKSGKLPRRLLGSHSLEAYGYRLGVLKGEYCKQEDAWDEYKPEMLEYCIQDVEVTETLYKKIIEGGATPEMIELENRFAEIIQEQEVNGICFNEKAAIDLLTSLYKRKEELLVELQEAFPPYYQPVDFGKTFTARGKRKTMPGLERGSEFCKIKLEEFNPGSRLQIVSRLMKKYNWVPEEVTDKGTPQINESILKSMPYPEARLLEEYLTVDKRISQLANGNQAWLKVVRNGKIHGRVNTGGAISGRCTHSSPNLAQVPSVSAPYGSDCRALFRASPGYKMVGCDASGLEIRCLAHYLAAYDKGEYADIVLNGDIHTANMLAAGLPDRNTAKTFFYGFLYGAGAVKIGKIVNGDAAEGARLQNRFLSKIPAIKALKESVAKVVKERKYLRGLDGRRMRTRSEHSALNLLLQGAGALVMKRFAIELYDATRTMDRRFVLNVHDEIQAEVAPEYVDAYSEECLKAFKKAGEYFKFRIRIDGEVKVGDNWKDTH